MGCNWAETIGGEPCCPCCGKNIPCEVCKEHKAICRNGCSPCSYDVGCAEHNPKFFSS